MEKEKIVRFEHLSPWLKFVVIYTLIQFGVTCSMLLLYAIIGIASI